MDKLDGKIALITGRSDGIVLATAIQFVAEGAYVFITGYRQEVLQMQESLHSHHWNQLQKNIIILYLILMLKEYFLLYINLYEFSRMAVQL